MIKRAPDPNRSVPQEIRSLVATRHILPTEDAKRYDFLFSALAEKFQPKDVLGWLDLKKLQDLMWDYFRLSRIKPEILNSERKDALASLLRSTGGSGRRIGYAGRSVSRAVASMLG